MGVCIISTIPVSACWSWSIYDLKKNKKRVILLIMYWILPNKYQRSENVSELLVIDTLSILRRNLVSLLFSLTKV